MDGVDVKKIKLHDLRSLMGIVSQEAILFNDTVFNNIAFGIDNANEHHVIEAARVANAHDFIMQLPEQYQTNIGDRGSKLSGGQRQRLSIARAVFKNPAILILDEATSALDTESEKSVQEALNNLMEGRTTLVIAHRCRDAALVTARTSNRDRAAPAMDPSPLGDAGRAKSHRRESFAQTHPRAVHDSAYPG